MQQHEIEQLIQSAQSAGVISIKNGVFLSTGTHIKERMKAWDEPSSQSAEQSAMWIYTEEGMFMPLKDPIHEVSFYA
jgi:hypothetical protein